jgi:NADH:ubiquinone oxidoreductase subunit 3 (subunit A)
LVDNPQGKRAVLSHFIIKNVAIFVQINVRMGASSLIVLIIAAIAFSGIAILVSKFVLKATTNKQKGEPYECGIPTKGKTWVQLNVGYYLFALIFLIFDVELVFLYPWAVVAKSAGWIAFVEIVIFFFILFMGFLYAHKKGALKWI